ncbi:hypothetical protein LE181_18650 [Streptomyces sp. SCA3-4]|uniref:hypothetical protein n=1 Tax=Streptomyces sichuanensis TaxID=2871810 RepID=UPI001CE32788|nr:hypothetical protein [Streptomyces sichuanensis]MCA6094175.1 hypothetical protein [Streptomyces sichuanensis]
MKLRHARTVAVSALVVVALTGARGHHGGSCGGGSSHSSSSSSSGGSSTSGGTTGGDSSGGTFGSTTSGGTTGGTTSGGTTTSGTSGDSTTGGSSTTIGGTGSSRNDAMRDVKINDCAYTDRLGITAKLSATNGSATLKYTYRLTVKFTAPDGTVTTRNPSIPYVMPGKTSTLDVSTPYVPKAGSPNSGGKCEVTNVLRTIEH